MDEVQWRAVEVVTGMPATSRCQWSLACARRAIVDVHQMLRDVQPAQLGNEGSTSTMVNVVPSCTSVCVNPVGCKKVSDG